MKIHKAHNGTFYAEKSVESLQSADALIALMGKLPNVENIRIDMDEKFSVSVRADNLAIGCKVWITSLEYDRPRRYTLELDVQPYVNGDKEKSLAYARECAKIVYPE